MLIKILTNMSLMFSLMVLVLSASNIGLLGVSMKPLDKIKNNRVIMIGWFVFACILTAFVSDTLLATILVPIGILYADKRGLSKIEMLVAIGFGSVVGNDLTYFGGGDTIVAWSLLENYLGRDLNMNTWVHMFWIPTLIGIAIAGTWLWFKTFENKIVSTIRTEDVEITSMFIIQTVIILLGITSVFFSAYQYYVIGFAVLSVILCRLNLEQLKRLPLKGIYVWTIALVIGNYISKYIKAHYIFNVPDNAYTFAGILLIICVVAILTNIITNSAMATILLPIVMALTFVDTIWLFVLVTKCISLSYLTIFANGCLAVTSSYGLNQKHMLKYGLPILVMQVLMFAVYFYIMRGGIII